MTVASELAELRDLRARTYRLAERLLGLQQKYRTMLSEVDAELATARQIAEGCEQEIRRLVAVSDREQEP